ncbi:hypothetical protein GL218_05718 [Daldinia childiae]|uniref:uncharacterized protein n=1 Tax=Daldinia childiae TaxID=326645 RepID=UPI0014470E29|nr:uncharacterized protein GL218_05718 [Daldinia childiae]KAF3058466.1 hypothetical protein GL218_05718 [Daldinia childiae]
MASQTSYSIRILVLSLITLILSYVLRDNINELFYPQLTVTIKNDSVADVLIIGGSHAGLSAALTLARHQIDVLIFDSNAPRNKWKTPTHVLPTWENQSPDELRRVSRKELSKTGLARFVNAQITTIKKPGLNRTFFEVGDAYGKSWRGRKLLLAMGVEFVFPEIKGYEENFPDRILHCLFTRGLEFKGSSSAGLLAMGLAGTPYHAAMLVEDAQKFADRVTVYTNGNAELGEGIRNILSGRGDEDIQVIDRQITLLSKDPESSGIRIQLDNGEIETKNFLVHQPDTRVNPEIVSQLELEINDRGDIVTRMPFYQTNVSGAFAAGDCASPFKMIPNTIFQGSNAGAGIARELPRRVTGHEIDRLNKEKQFWHWKLPTSTESWDASAAALLKTASEGPTTTLNKALLEKINVILPFSSSTGIFDTGCGVGQVLGSLLNTYGAALPPDARLVAADLSPGMIEIVNERKASEVAGGNDIWKRVETAVWDAQDLAAAGVPDQSFSHVTAGLLLLMVERPQDVLAETRRVMKSGGVFGMTSFRSVAWMDLIEEALAAVRPGTKLPPLPAAWASVERIREQLEGAGFRDVLVEEVQTFYEFEDPEAMTRFNVANIPSVKMVTADMTQDEVEKAIRWMLEWLGDRFPGGRGKLEGIAIIATGRK